jgi:hypothetical protein
MLHRGDASPFTMMSSATPVGLADAPSLSKLSWEDENMTLSSLRIPSPPFFFTRYGDTLTSLPNGTKSYLHEDGKKIL